MEHNSTLHNISDTFRARALTALALPHPFIMRSIASIAGALKGVRKHDVMKMVRTWSNSWTTSDRYKESCILQCLFGCRGELDSQKHYSKCPTLFAIVRCLRPSTPHAPKKGWDYWSLTVIIWPRFRVHTQDITPCAGTRSCMPA